MAVDRLTDYDLMILLAILVAGERAGAAAIARELQWRDCRSVVLGEIHAALDRLESNGLAVSGAGGPTSPRRRGARRAFEVTPAGLRAVESTQRALVARWKRVAGARRRAAPGRPRGGVQGPPLADVALVPGAARLASVALRGRAMSVKVGP